MKPISQDAEPIKPDPDLVVRTVEVLRNAQCILVVTGAGISADAGLPTYRGVGGLYDGVETEEGMRIEEILTPSMLRVKPELTWKYLHQLERAGRGVRPSAGHRVLAQMEDHFEQVMVITQNVDGLHRLAGSQDVVDIHGDFQRLFCTACEWEEVVIDYSHLADLPRCPDCQEVIRPDVVLFGEMLPTEKIRRIREEQTKLFDVVFSIGTSSLFPYIAAPVIVASRLGRPTIEINPQDTLVSDLVDIHFRCTAAAALPAIWSAYLEVVGA